MRPSLLLSSGRTLQCSGQHTDPLVTVDGHLGLEDSCYEHLGASAHIFISQQNNLLINVQNVLVWNRTLFSAEETGVLASELKTSPVSVG